jgi:putative YhdH/YhfP family quinone oxidoreductase
MSSYKAFFATNSDNNPDDFQNLKCEWTELELPKPGPGEVQIKVRYSSLNFKDALAFTGRGKILRQLPLTPGIDASGVVSASRSKNFKEGDEVVVTGCGLGESRNGGLGQFITAPEGWVVPRPANLSLRDCMVLGTAGFTAALALHQLEKNDLRPEAGEVLVTGATGGVGGLSLLLLKAKGYRAVAWTRKKETFSRLESWGASRCEDISTFDLKTRPLESARWAAAIDNVGGDILSYILPRIQPHGSVASIGLAKSMELKTTVFPFILRGVNLLGTSSATCPRPSREKIWRSLNECKIDWSKAVRDEIAPAQVPAECQRIADGQAWGRVVVDMEKA